MKSTSYFFSDVLPLAGYALAGFVMLFFAGVVCKLLFRVFMFGWGLL